MIPASQITQLWTSFFHAQVPAEPLALFRIFIGVILVLNGLLLLPIFQEFCGPRGVVSDRCWRQSIHSRNLCLLHYLPAGSSSRWLFLMGHLLACAAFLTGWHFQVASVLVFVSLVSIHHRNPWCLSSADSLLRLITFICCFSPAPAAIWTLESTGLPNGCITVEAWPARLIQILVCSVYLRTVCWKLRGSLWKNGTAAWYPLWADAWVRLRPPRWMLVPLTISIATRCTILLELALAFGLWISDVRLPLLLAGIAMHLVFDLILNLQLFSWVMITCLLLFLTPPEATSVFNLLTQNFS